jgi:hypothetical protein
MKCLFVYKAKYLHSNIHGMSSVLTVQLSKPAALEYAYHTFGANTMYSVGESFV